MNRRQLLTFQRSASSAAIAEPLTTAASGLTTYTGQWTEAEVVHLLRRTMFGATKADVNYFVSIGMAATVNELLTVPASAPAPPLYVYTSNYADPNVAQGQTWITAPYDTNANGYRLKSYRAWWISQMLNQTRSIQEKMTVFLMNHFSTQTATVNDARYCYGTNVVCRQFALGNFKALTKAITLDPGMLVYLSGYQNTKNAPNENYGREMQELFTIGKDANGVPYYTESDVQMAAKILTGYRINSTTIASYFDSTKHDTTNKTFSAFYNNTAINGQTGAAGANELDDLLNMIFGTQQSAIFLCTELYRYFLYYNIDADTNENVIQPLADIFRSGNYELIPVLQALLTSEHFYDPVNMGCLIKAPLDFMIGFCRDYGVVFPDSSLLTDQYNLWYQLYNYAAEMGQIIGDPPNVAGWAPYYQEPQYHELWINTSTLPVRNIFSDTMCSNGFKSPNSKIFFDVLAYTTLLDTPSDPNLLIQEVLDRNYSEDVTQDVITLLKGYLLNGQISDYYWTDAWNDYIGDPTDVTYANTVLTRLQAMYAYIMDLAEYQLS